MRVAAIYDIHANLPALEAVLAEIRAADVDRIVVGGDVVPGPMPRDSMAELTALEVPVDFIHGNGESEILAILAGAGPSAAVPPQSHDALRWVARNLSRAQRRVMAEWPLSLRLVIPGLGRVLFCHATPQNDTDVFTEATPEERLRPIFEGLDADLVICGHTHMQFDRSIGGVRVVNAGSVGMPFGGRGAYWLLLDSTVEFRHTSYDLVAAAERVRLTGYPAASEFADGPILAPPSQAEMIKLFERSSLAGE